MTAAFDSGSYHSYVRQFILGSMLLIFLSSCAISTEPSRATAEMKVTQGQPTLAPTQSESQKEEDSVANRSAESAGFAVEAQQILGLEIQLPEGIHLPPNSKISSTSESAIVLANADPEPVRDSVRSYCKHHGLTILRDDTNILVCAGQGMALRLDGRKDAQLLAWGPQDLGTDFAKDR